MRAPDSSAPNPRGFPWDPSVGPFGRVLYPLLLLAGRSFPVTGGPETTAQSYRSGENSPDSLGHRPCPFLPSIFNTLFCLLGPAVQQFVLLFT